MPKENRYNPKGLEISLLLQGGGALGSYQAGVYQALHEADLMPHWVVGTSIGAINAALIAGNPPENRIERLRQFWDRVSHFDWFAASQSMDWLHRFNAWSAIASALLWGVPGFFRPHFSNFLFPGTEVEPDMAGFYDTRPLLGTLNELIDFDYLNAPGGMRLTVNAMNVRTGQMAEFDNTRETITADHIRASGALPPGFPPVAVDGQLYWDGGLYSNTPLETVFGDLPAKDALCFMVDLWRAQGDNPVTMAEVNTRQKDVSYASRSERHIENYLNVHDLQCRIDKLYASLPKRARTSADFEKKVEKGCRSLIHIVRLAYTGSDWHMAAKDINFSAGSLRWRWQLGYEMARRSIERMAWAERVEGNIGLIVHEPEKNPAATHARQLPYAKHANG
ncbi:MAG: patatin-like phospholipase family protein [Burkholderiaceae bacterium]|nr:patatin-like phospholipase family protein [Burkholderiaceae bacterium]